MTKRPTKRTRKPAPRATAKQVSARNSIIAARYAVLSIPANRRKALDAIEVADKLIVRAIRKTRKEEREKAKARFEARATAAVSIEFDGTFESRIRWRAVEAIAKAFNPTPAPSRAKGIRK